MGCKAGRCNKTSTPKDIFTVIPPLEGWPTKAKVAPSPHEVRLTLLDTNSMSWEQITKAYQTTSCVIISLLSFNQTIKSICKKSREGKLYWTENASEY